MRRVDSALFGRLASLVRDWRFVTSAALVGLLTVGAPGARAASDDTSGDEIGVRVRVITAEPRGPVRLQWRVGGEGLGGEAAHGDLTESQVRPGTWSREVPLSSLGGKVRPPFMTFTASGVKPDGKPAPPLKSALFEIQFRLAGKVLKDIVENGPDGATASVHVPTGQAANGGKIGMSTFTKETMGLPEYANDRLRFLRSLPWSHAPVPRKLAIVTDLYGYGKGAGYTIRSTDKAVVETELQALRQLGVNGLRSAPDFVEDAIRAKTGVERAFSRVKLTRGLGYTVPLWDGNRNPASGCPYHPTMSGFQDRVKARTQALVDKALEHASEEEEWFLEVDEVGSVFDWAPESKAHQSVCPYCREAFRNYVRRAGYSLADLGAKSWDDVRSTYGYWNPPRKDAPPQAAGPAAKVDGFQLEKGETRPPAPAAPAVPPPGAPAGPPPIEQDGKRAPLSDKGWALLYYLSRNFNADSSAMLLSPEREFFEQRNDEKRRAMAEGRLDTPEAKRPWVYTYALRGVNFLIAGHSLDLFDFYRQADTGFMYETSNRDPRVWGWDSYVCDIGRMLSDNMGKRFGVYVKPHRGAVIQRSLSALSREAKVLFWYTYGPDWVKGDSFAQWKPFLVSTSRAARLLGASEDVLYDSKWAVPAEIAVVRPRTSEFFETNASWENGKWVYAALTHEHLPVDPIDEGMIESEDLTRYKVIYVSGSHLRRSSASRLAQWVSRGGVLYTSGFGLARNEANERLAELAPALGLRSRRDVELWQDMSRYGATYLPPLRKVKDTPAYAKVSGNGPFSGTFDVTLGREVLDPASDTEVLATYADGGAALTRHRYGSGFVYVAGVYAGDEYGVDVMNSNYDMSRDFSADKRAFISFPALSAGIRPVVASVGAPLVEGVLLRNSGTGKRAVSLMNWAYKAGSGPPGSESSWPKLVPVEELAVRIRGAEDVRRVVSAWTGRVLASSRDGDVLTVKVPKLEEADVLLLE